MGGDTVASWMVHLRVADELLDRLPDIIPLEFVFGNIAPDSGVPGENSGSYDPPKKVSHFHVNENGHRVAGYGVYAEKYLSPNRVSTYPPEEYSFHLGYFSHLYTDYRWTYDILRPLTERDAENYEMDSAAAIRKWKKDWYDLDFLYLREHPDFRAFSIFTGAESFENKYLDFFPKDAFTLSGKRVKDFYAEKRQGLDRSYTWLTPEEAGRFVFASADMLIFEISKMPKRK